MLENYKPRKSFEDKYIPVPECGCWLWIGKVHKEGYGIVGKLANGYELRAHRYSYELHNGEIPDGLLVCHKCDTRCCVNPDHLFLGTQKDNSDDMIRKGRDKKSPQHGENNNNPTKLKEYQAKAILKDTRTQKVIAAEYGVSVGTIGSIKQGLRWAYLQQEQ